VGATDHLSGAALDSCDFGHVRISWNRAETWSCPLCALDGATPEKLKELRSSLAEAETEARSFATDAEEAEEERDTAERKLDEYALALEDLLAAECADPTKCATECEHAPEHAQARKALAS
jgi:hypothetical protein